MCKIYFLACPELVAAIAAPEIIIPDVMELTTIADVRALIEKLLPAAYRSKFILADSTLSNPSFEGVPFLRVLLSWDSGDASHEAMRDIGGVVLDGD